MTITSGLAQVGKTHLAVNLALELARRGRRVSIYHELETASPVDGILALPHALTPRRRATDAQEVNDFIRRAYLGTDILSCRLPLRSWAGGDAKRLAACLDGLLAQQAYDDHLIDTSGMDPRSLVASCRASASVILVVTPDTHSQAEAFALLKVLVLNGYAGELWLLVNRLPDAKRAQEIQQRFTTQVHAHLGGEVPLLGSMPEDAAVPRSETILQAYSALFPDSEAAAAILRLADALPAGPAVDSAHGDLRRFWDRFIEIMQEPVHLAGNALLKEEPVVAAGQPHTAAPGAVSTDMNLLSHAGELADLPVVLERAAESLQVAAATLGAFVARLDAPAGDLPATPLAQLESSQLPTVLAQLLAVLAKDTAHAPVDLWLDATSVARTAGDWLQPGRYLKYTVQMALPGGVAETRLRTLLADVPVQQAPGAGTLQEILTARHDACLDVYISPGDGVRIQAWLPVAATAPAGLPAAGVVPVDKRLH